MAAAYTSTFFSIKGQDMRKGFALIELLVVVLIMGILASVAMPQYFKSVEKSRSAEAIEVLSAIVDAEEREHMKKWAYNAKLAQLDVGIRNLSYFTFTARATDKGEYYVAQVDRIDEAGAGLGRYYIALRYPTVPGTGQRTWVCGPASSGWKSLLPK